MDRVKLLELVRTHGRELVDEFLPPGANCKLEELINERRLEVDVNAYRVFVSLGALLQNQHGVRGCESNAEAGKIMALLRNQRM